MAKIKATTVNVAISTDLHDRLRVRADLEGRKLKVVVERLLLSALAQESREIDTPPPAR